MAVITPQTTSRSIAIVALLIGATLNAAPVGAQSCDSSYPDFCIPPPFEVGDLDCEDIPGSGFTVLQPDPHFLDDDFDGIGCEWF